MPDLSEPVCIDDLARLMLRLKGLKVKNEEPPVCNAWPDRS